MKHDSSFQCPLNESRPVSLFRLRKTVNQDSRDLLRKPKDLHQINQRNQARPMPPTLPNDLSAPQITKLIEKATVERANLDAVILKKLEDSMEIEQELTRAKREVDMHRRIEGTRREMEKVVGELDKKMEELAAQKQMEKEKYQVRLRKLQEVIALPLIGTRANLFFLGACLPQRSLISISYYYIRMISTFCIIYRYQSQFQKV